MPAMSDMTVRTWSATATETGASEYSRYFAATLLDFDRTATY
jgi:hypothetical protein